MPSKRLPRVMLMGTSPSEVIRPGSASAPAERGGTPGQAPHTPGTRTRLCLPLPLARADGEKLVLVLGTCLVTSSSRAALSGMSSVS